ncbi:MAG: P-loop NTPase fold protein [Nitrospira sp.]
MNFSADRPIEHLKDDRLRRTSFVNSIAAAIKGWKGNESLVIGISGSWGSGKSSTKNMIKEVLSSSEARTQVIEFNPWQWAGQDQLGQAFFREIEIALGKAPSSDNKKSAAQWRVYSARLRVGSILSGTTSQVLLRILLVLGGSGLAWTLLTDHLVLSIWLLILTSILVAWEKISQKLYEFASNLADLKEAQAILYELSTEDLKAELRRTMEALSEPILVIIDDIDRLTATQIGYLFQLVKANADFPNLIYMLLMEREIVEKSLDEITTNNGKSYLDKIVQINLILPTISRSALLQILEQEILSLLNRDSSTDEYDQHRLSSAFSLISTNFTTLRAVHRFTNAFAFNLSALRGDRSLSVNKIDLMCLSVIKLFYEEAYQHLHKAKRLLIREHRSDEDVLHLKKAVVASCREDEKKPLLHLLAFLFPQFPWDDHILQGQVLESEALTSLRICHRKNFDRYFVGHVDAADVTPDEFDEFISNLSSREKTRENLLLLHERGCLLSIFERLEAYVQDVQTAHIAPLLTALFDVADAVIVEYWLDYSCALDRRLTILSSEILQKIENSELRLQLLSNSIEATTGLCLATETVFFEEPDSRRQAIGGLSEDQLRPLREMCLLKIRAWAADGRLIDHTRLGHILSIWIQWTPGECKNWIATQIENKDGQVRMACSILSCTIDSEGTHFVPNLESLDKLVDSRILHDKLSLLDSGQLTEEERRSVSRFNVAFTQREQQRSRAAIKQASLSNDEGFSE